MGTALRAFLNDFRNSGGFDGNHLTVQEGEDRDDLKFWCGPLDQQIYYHHFVLYIKLGLPLTSGA